MPSIWVYSEVQSVALELVRAGLQLKQATGWSLVSASLGADALKRAEELAEHGVDKAVAVSGAVFEQFDAEVYAKALAKLVGSEPTLVLVGGTKRGKELAPRLATKLDAGCVTDCIELSYKDDMIYAKRSAYGGVAIATMVSPLPLVVTIPPRKFEAAEKAAEKGSVEQVSLELPGPRVKVVEVRKKEVARAKLDEARVIVSAGRGVKAKQDLEMLRELAELLGGEVGCSRPVAADRGWFPQWIGLSGVKVKPDLYIAVGISGALQHIAGIRDSKIIVAINKDPEAPIFKVADYGIVGDLYKVIPALKNAVEKAVRS
ncbi:MAG: electron transfer flavoprotein subunit alpha/FixB family protein [Thermoproteota archaeon]|nr:MAG: electron transfer flavoprotein subunit alpha/FixB family protein [Candidatus Korarchaeota archaeon]RLG55966.1 MAG: electron transfer flavoprotein subunit alpha/FixB family protein [Candidatus Korarchaeota archaeon]